MQATRRSVAHVHRLRGVVSGLAACVLVALAPISAPAASIHAGAQGCHGPQSQLLVSWDDGFQGATAIAVCPGDQSITRAIQGSSVTTCAGEVIVGGPLGMRPLVIGPLPSPIVSIAVESGVSSPVVASSVDCSPVVSPPPAPTPPVDEPAAPPAVISEPVPSTPPAPRPAAPGIDGAPPAGPLAEDEPAVADEPALAPGVPALVAADDPAVMTPTATGTPRAAARERALEGTPSLTAPVAAVADDPAGLAAATIVALAAAGLAGLGALQLARSPGGARTALLGGTAWAPLAFASVALTEWALQSAPLGTLDTAANAAWRLPLLLLLLPPWAVARQVRGLTHAPRAWLRTTDLLFAAACAWLLVIAANPSASQWPPDAATTGFWLLGGLLVLAAAIASRRMIRATRTVDPRIALLRGRALLAGALLFMVAWAAWVVIPPGEGARIVFAAPLLAGILLLVFTTRIPRPVIGALDLSMQHEMVQSIEQLVATSSPRSQLEPVLASFAQGVGVYGIAVLGRDGELLATGGPAALAQEMGSGVGREVREPAGAGTVIAWQSPLAPELGDAGRARLRVAGRLVQAAIERERLVEVERDAVMHATETAHALEAANATLRDANELKGRFVSLVSHELRTPLTSIIGLARTADERWDDLDPGQVHQFQGIIADQGERLNRLVEELLLIGRIEEGRLHVTDADVDLTEAVEDAIIDSAIDHQRVSVQMPRGPRHVRTDRQLLHELLVNYLSNARKYGAPPVSVQFARGEDDALEVWVADRGAGVPEELRPHLFERFVRGDVDPAVPGTGLGLAIVRELAETLGGSVSYAPRPGGGSTFGFRIPAEWIVPQRAPVTAEPAGGAARA